VPSAATWVWAGMPISGVVCIVAAPALLLAGFSLSANQLQWVFALIELLRGLTAFLVVAPLLLHLGADGWTQRPWASTLRSAFVSVAQPPGSSSPAGMYVFGKAGFEKPDITRWQGKRRDGAGRTKVSRDELAPVLGHG
jgi:hypothetical protein